MRVSLNNEKSIERAIRSLEKYRDSLPKRSETFVNRLLAVGISTAKVHTGKYGGYIKFERQVNGTEGMLVATNSKKLVKMWYDKRGRKIGSYEVSPILLAEFGSGWLADVVWDVAGVGQGTMPNAKGHAKDPQGWQWYDSSGRLHHSIGEVPTYPMHNAMVAMINEINSIGQEVFKYG